MSTTKDDFTALIDTMTRLGSALGPALDAQYEAPPGRRRSSGVPDPTLDTVLDPRRQSLSDEVRATGAALRQARACLAPHIPALNAAVNRWQGQEGTKQ